MEPIATAVNTGSLRNTRKAWLTDGNMDTPILPRECTYCASGGLLHRCWN
jgi:hypothetical protein